MRVAPNHITLSRCNKMTTERRDVTARTTYQLCNGGVCACEYARGLTATLHRALEVTSVLLAGPLTRPDDSSRLHYIQESASFSLGSERGGGEINKSTRGRRASRPKRCSPSIVIIHDRMQFQTAAGVSVLSHHRVGVRRNRTIRFHFVLFGN